MEINDTAVVLPENTGVQAEEVMFAIKPIIRALLLLLALTGAIGLAGCHITFGSVDLDRIENPRDWGRNSGGSVPEGPTDR